MTQRPERPARPDRSEQPGYRGALPPRDDALARPWVVVVIAAFLLMFVLAFVGFPSGVLKGNPSPSAVPSISISPSGSSAASGSAGASPSASPGAS